MKLANFTVLALAVLFAESADACKCNNNHNNNNARTQLCCSSLGGVYSNGDCAANSISNQLSGFSKCCHAGGFVSDCPCPSGCSGADIEAEQAAERRASFEMEVEHKRALAVVRPKEAEKREAEEKRMVAEEFMA